MEHGSNANLAAKSNVNLHVWSEVSLASTP